MQRYRIASLLFSAVEGQNWLYQHIGASLWRFAFQFNWWTFGIARAPIFHNLSSIEANSRHVTIDIIRTKICESNHKFHKEIWALTQKGYLKSSKESGTDRLRIEEIGKDYSKS